MRILVVGAGGVGAAVAAVARRREFFEHATFTDYDLARAERAAAGDSRFAAAQRRLERRRRARAGGVPARAVPAAAGGVRRAGPDRGPARR